MESLTLHLPYPPTVNHYLGHRAVGRKVIVYVTPEGKAYRDLVTLICRDAPTLDGELSVAIEYWTPDKRKRDIDNILKCLLDACTHAGIWRDDNQIRDLSVLWRGCERPDGRILMRVKQRESMLF